MARMSVEELYRGKGAGAKYGFGVIMGEVMKEILTRGVPVGYDEQTWIETLIIKHTLAAAEKNKIESDCISEMTDMESLFSYAEVRNEDS